MNSVKTILHFIIHSLPHNKNSDKIIKQIVENNFSLSFHYRFLFISKVQHFYWSRGYKL